MSTRKAQKTKLLDSDSPPERQRIFHFWRCFWLTVLAVSLAIVWYSYYAPANDIDWADNYASARQQAAASGKPMILYFTGTWCVPCRIMKRQVWADDQVMALVNGGFVPVAMDVQDPENAEVMKQYKIGGLQSRLFAIHKEMSWIGAQEESANPNSSNFWIR